MKKTVVNERLLIDNGADYFFEDDRDFGWVDLEGAIKSLYMMGTDEDLGGLVKLKLDREYSDGSYSTKTIASFNSRLLPKTGI